MREIKFRVWNRHNEKFRYFDLFEINKGLLCSIDEEDDIPQQYTGLKDKNGVEIYEGDIVEWQYCLMNPNRDLVYRKRFTITYCEEDAMFLGKKDPERRGGAERNWFYSKEVIGNIFEGVDK